MKSVMAIVVFMVCLLPAAAVHAGFPEASRQSVAADSPSGNLVTQVSGFVHHNYLFTSLIKAQEKLNRSLATDIKALKKPHHTRALFLMLVIAFIYGVVHAVGPGHGKSVISSWVVAKQRSLREVVCVSVFSAVFHALSAVLLIGGTYVLVGKLAAVSTQKLNDDLQIVGAVFVIAIGLAMVVRAVRKKISTAPADGGKPGRLIAVLRGENPLCVALSVGIVPCPVTSIILIFCLGESLVWQGALLVVSFAVGMGATLVIMGYLVWSLRGRILNHRFFSGHSGIARVFPAFGGILLVFFGATMLMIRQ